MIIACRSGALGLSCAQTLRTWWNGDKKRHGRRLGSKPLDDGKVEVLFEAEGVQYVALNAFPFEPDSGYPESVMGPCPVTVIAVHHDVLISHAWLDEYLGQLDDEGRYGKTIFLTGLIITNAKRGERTITPDGRRYLKSFGNKWLEIRDDEDISRSLEPGPYLYTQRTLKSVCRLYRDTQGAFVTAVKPKPSMCNPSAFEPLVSSGGEMLHRGLLVAVPPRTPDIPNSRFRRLRVAVKDCYFLEGMKNSLCNSAYYETSSPAPFTATVVQLLVKNGAHILGLTKLSSMIAREEPMDSVDYLVSFNPRGDGYQSPAGSSSGSAVVTASYEWVDCAIGTDTTGSGRRPALVNGVWQFRPSHDTRYLDGLVKTYAPFDTPCVFARSLVTLKYVVETWLQKEIQAQSATPTYEIIYPLDFLPVANARQMEHIDKFVNDMKDLLPAVVTKLSIKDTWRAEHPPGTPESLDEHLKDVVAHTFYSKFYHASDGFRKQYAEDHDGQSPYVIPFVQRRWARGAAVTPAEHEDATQRMRIYKKWLENTFFSSGDKETFIILPISNVAPHYRDEVAPSPDNQSALDQLFLSPILGAPDISVPIGEVPYNSKITGRREFLPVVVNIVAAPRADVKLFQAVERVMRVSKRPTEVSTGSRMFPKTKA